jgi:hypothetical protein
MSDLTVEGEMLRTYIEEWFFSTRNNMNLKRKGMGIARLGLVALLILAGILYLASRKLQTHAQNQGPKHIRVSAIDDWSHRHLVYSAPSLAALSLKLQSEPRYQLQLQKRNAATTQRDTVAK